MLEDEEGGEASPLPELHLQFPRRGAVTSQGASGNWNSPFFMQFSLCMITKPNLTQNFFVGPRTHTALPQGMS